MNTLEEMSAKDYYQPAIATGGVIGLCVIVKNLTGYSLGVECNRFSGVFKTFLLFTTSGVLLNWYKKEKNTS